MSTKRKHSTDGTARIVKPHIDTKESTIAAPTTRGTDDWKGWDLTANSAATILPHTKRDMCALKGILNSTLFLSILANPDGVADIILSYSDVCAPPSSGAVQRISSNRFIFDIHIDAELQRAYVRQCLKDVVPAPLGRGGLEPLELYAELCFEYDVVLNATELNAFGQIREDQERRTIRDRVPILFQLMDGRVMVITFRPNVPDGVFSFQLDPNENIELFRFQTGSVGYHDIWSDRRLFSGTDVCSATPDADDATRQPIRFLSSQLI